MTYAEKLRDIRWFEFREAFVKRQPLSADYRHFCCDCGVEDGTDGPESKLNVHHRHYIDGKEPWEYEDQDLLLICDKCHGYIHETETRARNLVRSLEPHECFEFRQLLEALELAQKSGKVKVGLARAKNVVRDISYE